MPLIMGSKLKTFKTFKTLKLGPKKLFVDPFKTNFDFWDQVLSLDSWEYKFEKRMKAQEAGHYN